MKEIAVLGSTGSIGKQTLDVIRAHPERFHASVIAAKTNISTSFFIVLFVSSK